jgi:hypothetical protein
MDNDGSICFEAYNEKEHIRGVRVPPIKGKNWKIVFTFKKRPAAKRMMDDNQVRELLRGLGRDDNYIRRIIGY